ncbi:Glycerol-1-phosphate phosphohydrolase 2 [Nymphon striatum]|nr:Glycerol-1-phosphate phosphohydrolase 2 [Nymphon striatum]
MQATVSNSDRIIVQKNLHRLGINRPEFVSVALNDVHEGKPHPEPYIRAAHLLGVAVEKYLQTLRYIILRNDEISLVLAYILAKALGLFVSQLNLGRILPPKHCCDLDV